MKKILIIIVFYIIHQPLNAMVINDIIITPINTQDINVHLKVTEASVFNFINSSYVIENNTITLTVCYNLQLFLTVTTLENDFIINSVNNGLNNYTLVVNVNYRTNNICANGTFSDSETINFNTPVNNSVSLSNSSFKKNIDPLLLPNPTSGLLKLNGIDNKIFSVYVFDNFGREIVAQKNIINTIIDISNLTDGYYFIKIYTDVGSYLKKVILKK
jgi:hypothetical protein